MNMVSSKSPSMLLISVTNNLVDTNIYSSYLHVCMRLCVRVCVPFLDCNTATGMPLPKTPDHSSSNGNTPSKSGGSNSLSADSSPSSGVIRTNSLRKATLTKSKQPVVRSTSVHSTSLTRKLVTVKILKGKSRGI